MNIDKVRSEFRHELRHVVWEGEVVERLASVTRRSSANGQLNWVTAFELEADTADCVIQEEIAHYQTLGKEFEWKAFSFDSPPDLVDRLRAHGLSVGDREAIVVYDLTKGLTPFDGPFPCEVKRILTKDQLADFRQVAETVFKKDYALTTNQLAEALRTGRKGHDAYIAYVDGVPSAIGRMYTDPQSAFAGLDGGGTRKEYRSRGCYRAITAERAKDAVLLGARYLQVDALPTSLPILLRLGFAHLADTWPCAMVNE